MQFDAELTNPRPAGTILTSGNVGPWVVEDPGETPVDGNYRFEHADLSVFKGIAGILNSTGKYQGVLRDLTVDGQTDTPDFRLTHFGTAVPLHTQFHAQRGRDKWRHLAAAGGRNAGAVALYRRGQIVRVPPGALANGVAQPGGHEIALKVNVDRGRMEDFLRLTSNSGTPSADRRTGAEDDARDSAGNGAGAGADEAERELSLEDAAFTSTKIQDDVGRVELARAGPADRMQRTRRGPDVRSTMQSDFTMADGVITLPNLKYTVPGAEIDLAGHLWRGWRRAELSRGRPRRRRRFRRWWADGRECC